MKTVQAEPKTGRKTMEEKRCETDKLCVKKKADGVTDGESEGGDCEEVNVCNMR